MNTRYSLNRNTRFFGVVIGFLALMAFPLVCRAVQLNIADVCKWNLSGNSATITNGVLDSDGSWTANPLGGITSDVRYMTGGENINYINGMTVYVGGYSAWTQFIAVQESWGDYSYTQSFTVASLEYTILNEKYSVVSVNSAPIITTPPVAQTVIAGNNVTFSVVATGAPAPTYQWKFNNTVISGATRSSYTINNVSASNAGSYTVTVTNAKSSITSAAATLIVSPAAPVVATATYAGAAIGELFNYTIEGTNTPTSYGATGLPAGLTINSSSGEITGSPTASGAFSVLLSATNATGTGTAALTVVVAPETTVTTFAGILGTSGSTNATGTVASFNGPNAMTFDSTGNIYVADQNNHIIRKVSTTGVVTTIAGQAGSTGSLDGNGLNARFNTPVGIAIDSTGNLFVTDSFNCTIRKITPAGQVTTLAGAAGVYGSADNTIGTLARFDGPAGIVIDSSNNLYVADLQNSTIRKITAEGAVTTVAGKADVFGSNNGEASSATFGLPYSLALDKSGNLYVGEDNNTIRRITLNTNPIVVSKLVGESGVSGSRDYPALFGPVRSLACDRDGNIYAGDLGYATVRRIDPGKGMVTTMAGMAGTRGSINGTGNAARFSGPAGLAVDANGVVFVADSHAIRLLSFGPSITTHPQSQSVMAGANVSFAVTALASPTSTCQWYKGNVLISGATSPTLSLNSVQAADAGSYTVTLTNASGSARSNVATLTVTSSPTNSSSSSSSSSSGGGNGGGGGLPSGWCLISTFLLLLFGRKRLALCSSEQCCRR